jgi:hypothetical protein
MARDTRQYVIGGVRYPSPSEIQGALGFNAGLDMIPEGILNEAAARGNRVHDWCEKFMLGENPQIPAAIDEELRCSGFMDWFDETEPDVVDVEMLVWTDEHRVAGKLDILIREDDKICIVDIKTGNAPKIYANYPVQQAFYSISVKERMGLDYLPKRYILQLPKSGAYRIKELDNPEDFDVAAAAAKVAWRLIDEKLLKLE